MNAEFSMMISTGSIQEMEETRLPREIREGYLFKTEGIPVISRGEIGVSGVRCSRLGFVGSLMPHVQNAGGNQPNKSDISDWGKDKQEQKHHHSTDKTDN